MTTNAPCGDPPQWTPERLLSELLSQGTFKSVVPMKPSQPVELSEYTMQVQCKNCDYDGPKKFSKGVEVGVVLHECPNCGCRKASVIRKEKPRIPWIDPTPLSPPWNPPGPGEPWRIPAPYKSRPRKPWEQPRITLSDNTNDF